MKSKFARKVHLASTQTELPHSHTPPAPAPAIGKFVAGNVRILLARQRARGAGEGWGDDKCLVGAQAGCATPQSEINFR